jgi:poly-beta-hydroxybutyrate-responsive repressor
MEKNGPRGDANADPGAKRVEGAVRPRNWLQPFLLLCLQQWQSYGYDLMRRLALFGFEATGPGSVYRTLRQLEKEGLVRSDWDTSQQGPARRMYSLTDAGAAYLETWASALRDSQSMLDRFFSFYTNAPGGSARDPEH